METLTRTRPVVLITGGSRGIGAAAARRFARGGWDVAVGYRRSREQAETLVRELEALGARAAALPGDISQRPEAQALVRQAEELLGPLDALVCSAGVAPRQMLLTDLPAPEWREVMSVNLDSAFHLLQAAVPGFVRRQRGAIVTVSSMWGQVGASCEVAYSAAKGAVIAFSKALAKEMGPSGVRVNCVCPGVIDTEMNAHLSPADRETLRLETPLERLGTPEEVAETICFLAGPESRFVTGQVLGVNGGMVI